MRSNYWTNSNIANRIRGTPKPGAETSEGWRAWTKKAKIAHPVRYWLAEEGLDYLQDFVMWPIDKLYALKYYINNRFVTHTHALTAHPRDISRGTWCDLGNRFLPCLFNELVEFVEVELAWFQIAWDKEARKKYQTPWWGVGWFRWRTWRSQEAGLDNLAWQMALTNEEFLDDDKKSQAKPTLQAIHAKEIFDLYIWWTEERPKRVDPMEVSGWNTYCDQRKRKDSDDWVFESNKDVTGPMFDYMHEIEAKYDKEDEEMLIRLIKIRHALWT